MSELQNPVAAAVASVLKSLRTRAGLREDRLSGTELALGVLLGLDSVREFTAAGWPAEQAIVRAVRDAAGALEPTLSIVADASLALELSAGQINDPELYARDLGQRRDALLRNWDRLHQLRSVPPARLPSARSLRLEVEAEALAALAVAMIGPGGSAAPYQGPTSYRGLVSAEEVVRPQPDGQPQVPQPGSAELQAFGAELREALATRGLTAQEVASRLGVPMSLMTNWLDGTDLPSEANARSLDQCLTARGAIMNLVLELRPQPAKTGITGPGGGVFVARPAREPAGTLGEVFQQVAAALRGSLIRADDGTPLGWPHDLRQLAARPTVGATTYGLKTMLLIEGDLAPDLVTVAKNLRTMWSEGSYTTMDWSEGNYTIGERADLRPEVNASVIDTLRWVDGTADFSRSIAAMWRDLSDFEKSRPFVLATMLEASLRLRGAEDLTEALAKSLLKARRRYGNRLLWPEKSEPLLIDPAPSAAHTAMAVRILAKLHMVRPDEQTQAAVEQGVTWLLEQRHFQNVVDVVDRPVSGRFELIYTRHFTAAWVVRALLSTGVPVTHPTVSSAINQVWDSYAGDQVALWKWGNGDLPIWMTFDAIDALRLVSLATPARPGQ